MNDFTICSCRYCGTERMRGSLSNCVDCDKLTCDFTDISCGIDCPICMWFVCGCCIFKHKETCWDSSSLVEKFNIGPAGTEYHFSQKQETKLPPSVQVFTNEEGFITKIIMPHGKSLGQ